MNKKEEMIIKQALHWKQACEKANRGCWNCPNQGNCILAAELLFEMWLEWLNRTRKGDSR